MIKIENLSKSFGEKKVIENFNFEINDGEMIAITGKSGCGKSTLLNILGLLDNEYDGNVFYDEKLLKNEKESRRNKFIRNNINYLFQNYALVDTDTVYENLLLALEYEKISHKEKAKRIDSTLTIVGLKGFENKKIYTLSGGEQQRVALARVILKKGTIILADEPTGNLDKENSDKIIEILKKLQENGKTIIIVTHDEEIAKKCDNIVKL